MLSFHGQTNHCTTTFETWILKLINESFCSLGPGHSNVIVSYWNYKLFLLIKNPYTGSFKTALNISDCFDSLFISTIKKLFSNILKWRLTSGLDIVPDRVLSTDRHCVKASWTPCLCILIKPSNMYLTLKGFDFIACGTSYKVMENIFKIWNYLGTKALRFDG